MLMVVAELVLIRGASASSQESTSVQISSVPESFTTIEFKGHPDESRLLSQYLWYHYKTRRLHFKALFPQEYLTTADMWLARTPQPIWGEGKSIQQKHRESLLEMKIDEEGYILTNQHFSHCHEKAWPFPLWVQGYRGEGLPGAAGWHFNYEGIGWMWDMFLKTQLDSRFARDNAWQRLLEILDWEKEVWAEGGYREFYKDGKQGTTLQGGGTAGGIGIDAEFFESSLMPSIVTYGFMGIDPQGRILKISPKMPVDCPEMTIRKMQYHNVLMDVRCSNDSVSVALRDEPVEPIVVVLAGRYKNTVTNETGNRFELSKAGTYTFTRK